MLGDTLAPGVLLFHFGILRPALASLAVTAAPLHLLNATLTEKHTYVLYTSITSILESSVNGYAKATAKKNPQQPLHGTVLLLK